MSFRHTSRSRCIPALLFVLLGGLLSGCGPTRTAGTNGIAAKDLAVLSIAQLPGGAPVHIQTIQFDGSGDIYKVDDGRDFYVLPRDHTASLTFSASLPSGAGFLGWLIPKGSLTLPPLKDIPLGEMMAGKAYELAPPSGDTFGSMLQGGQLSLVREKAK